MGAGVEVTVTVGRIGLVGVGRTGVEAAVGRTGATGWQAESKNAIMNGTWKRRVNLRNIIPPDR
jgi:ribosomal protein S28E/S33